MRNPPECGHCLTRGHYSSNCPDITNKPLFYSESSLSAEQALCDTFGHIPTPLDAGDVCVGIQCARCNMPLTSNP